MMVDGGLLSVEAERIDLFGSRLTSADSDRLGLSRISLSGNTHFHAPALSVASAGPIDLSGSLTALTPGSDLTFRSDQSLRTSHRSRVLEIWRFLRGRD